MKIGFDAKRAFLNQTGLGNYSRTLLSGLQQFSEHKCTLFTPKLHPKNTFSLQNQFKTIVPSSKVLWRSNRILHDLIQQQIELYHGLSNEIPFSFPSSALKSVVTIHDLIPYFYPETYPVLDRILYKRKFAHAIQHSNHIIAISEATKQDILKLFPVQEEKISVHYQSIQSEFLSDIPLPSLEELQQFYSIPSSYFLYVGTVAERKNLNTLLQAYTSIQSHDFPPLIIIGNGGVYKSSLQSKYKEYSNIIWLSNVASTQHLKAFYQNAIASIYVSLYEGFGLPVTEALASGCQVITSAISSMPEAAGGFAKLVDPKSEKEISTAIQHAFEIFNGSHYKKNQSAIDWVRNEFQLEKSTKALCEIYTRI